MFCPSLLNTTMNKLCIHTLTKNYTIMIYTTNLLDLILYFFFNPLPHISIFGPCNSAANKDMMSKTWTNGDTTF